MGRLLLLLLLSESSTSLDMTLYSSMILFCQTTLLIILIRSPMFFPLLITGKSPRHPHPVRSSF